MSDELKNAKKWASLWKQMAKEYKRYWKQDKNALNHAYSTIKRLNYERDTGLVEAIKRGELPNDRGLTQFNLTDEDIEKIHWAISKYIKLRLENANEYNFYMNEVEFLKHLVELRELFRKDSKSDLARQMEKYLQQKPELDNGYNWTDDTLG